MPDQDAADRSSHRRHLIFYLRVTDRNSGELLGYLNDISETGLMLMSNEPVEKDKRYDLSVLLNEPVNDRKSIEFSARCIWCHPTVNPDIYDAGFQFERLDLAVVDTIRDVIEQMGFRDD